MIDYLTQQKYIDNNRIGSLGICGGGGYTLATAQIDKRIKAVATLSMFNTGRVRKNGFRDNDKENIQTRLEKAATARTLEQKGTIQYEGDNPEMTEEQTRQLMETLPEGLYKDGVEYYGITHKHPNSNSKYTTASLQKLMAFDVDDHMDLITQPLLMIAGDKADTIHDRLSIPKSNQHKKQRTIPNTGSNTHQNILCTRIRRTNTKQTKRILQNPHLKKNIHLTTHTSNSFSKQQ